jgi:hypothetical protein
MKYESYNFTNILIKCLYEQGLRYENNKIKPIEQVQCINDYLIDDKKVFTKNTIYNIKRHYFFTNTPNVSYYILTDDNNIDRRLEEQEFKNYFLFI